MSIHGDLQHLTPQIKVKINNLFLKQISEIIFLGMTINNTLNWRSHVDEIKTKLCKITGFVYEIRDNIHTESLKRIYLSTVYSHLLYCCAVCGETFKTPIESLFVAPQNCYV